MISTFYLIKSNILKPDVYYKIYITNDSCYFIKVGGQFHNRYAYEKQLPEVLELLFSFWFKRMQQKQKVYEEMCDNLIQDQEVSSVLQKKDNFTLMHEEIRNVVLNKQGTFHTAFHDNGTVVFQLKSDQKLKFIIPRSISRESIKTTIEQNQGLFSVEER